MGALDLAFSLARTTPRAEEVIGLAPAPAATTVAFFVASLATRAGLRRVFPRHRWLPWSLALWAIGVFGAFGMVLLLREREALPWALDIFDRCRGEGLAAFQDLEEMGWSGCDSLRLLAVAFLAAPLAWAGYAVPVRVRAATARAVSHLAGLVALGALALILATQAWPPAKVAVLGALLLLASVASAVLAWRWRWTARRRRARTCLQTVLALVVLACSDIVPRFAPPPSSELAPPGGIRRVLLIVDDTLRADAVSFYAPGDPDVSTPHIDSLARDGSVFMNAMTTASWTMPAMASILTGVAPPVHTVLSFGSRLPDELTTLAEYLGAAGFRTAAIGENVLLLPEGNFTQGFEEYDFRPRLDGSLGEQIRRRLRPGQPTDQMTRRAVDWLRRHRDQAFFLWLHYYNPHDPYAPPSGFFPTLPPAALEPSLLRSVAVDQLRHRDLSPEARRWVRRLYNAEVRQVDASVGRILEELRRLDLYDETLIVFTSDHGEEFWDHGGVEHGTSLHRELLWVPLIVKEPSPTGHRRVDAPVSLSAIVPTILDLCGIRYDPVPLAARSLAGGIEGALQRQPAPVFSTGLIEPSDEQIAVVFGSNKFIWHLRDGSGELFDLSTDGAEATPLPPSSLQAEALTLIRDHLVRSEAQRHHLGLEDQTHRDLDPLTIRRLRTLGYLK